MFLELEEKVPAVQEKICWISSKLKIEFCVQNVRNCILMYNRLGLNQLTTDTLRTMSDFVVFLDRTYVPTTSTDRRRYIHVCHLYSSWGIGSDLLQSLLLVKWLWPLNDPWFCFPGLIALFKGNEG